ncbi:hypothetical protein [Entomohabitans teleogrylli]|uniref:hypothetical protein n=1 Tax=Entomohabitans teleogrylli TaxID=1384589 RepID=UPI00073D7A3A|nr:hypothetical protein [Entomohabitans teleogrylli]
MNKIMIITLTSLLMLATTFVVYSGTGKYLRFVCNATIISPSNNQDTPYTFANYTILLDGHGRGYVKINGEVIIKNDRSILNRIVLFKYDATHYRDTDLTLHVLGTRRAWDDNTFNNLALPYILLNTELDETIKISQLPSEDLLVSMGSKPLFICSE